MLLREWSVARAEVRKPARKLLWQKWTKTLSLSRFSLETPSSFLPHDLGSSCAVGLEHCFLRSSELLILSFYSRLHVNVTSTEIFPDHCIKDNRHLCQSFSTFSHFPSYYLLFPAIAHSIYLLLLFSLSFLQEFTFYRNEDLVCPFHCCRFSTWNCA